MGIPYAEVIGDPVAHSKSPLIHKFWLAKLGLPWDFRVTQVVPDRLASFLESRRQDPQWCGCSVTLPHKQSVMALIDGSANPGPTLGAVNCIVRERNGRLIGHNTDWRGFLEPLQPRLELNPLSRMARVIGTGGAAVAVSYALNRSNFTIVSVARDFDKALALRKRLELFDDDLIMDLPDREAGAEWGDRHNVLDLLVNATPLGMTGFPPLPVAVRSQPVGTIVYDLVYHPLETELLRAARAAGMPTIDGLAMLIGQAAIAFELFFAEAAPREHDSELRELLTR
ncbi:MAG: shikimate dehydrogenase family protein [Allosphingosinicella sp.]